MDRIDDFLHHLFLRVPPFGPSVSLVPGRPHAAFRLRPPSASLVLTLAAAAGASCEQGEASLAWTSAVPSTRDGLVCGIEPVEPPGPAHRDPCRDGTTLLGPVQIGRKRCPPAGETWTFEAPSEGFACISARDVTPADVHHRVSAAWIWLDGGADPVLPPERFGQQILLAEEIVALGAGAHELRVRTASKPGTLLEVEMKLAPAPRHAPVEGAHLELFGLDARPAPFAPALGAARLVVHGTVLRYASLPSCHPSTFEVRYSAAITQADTCQLVRTLTGMQDVTGDPTFTTAVAWDGRDGAGAPVPDGTYLYSFTADLVQRSPHGEKVLERLATRPQALALDATPPEIAILAPPDPTASPVPIAVSYHDDGMGIDLASLRFTVDGAPVTAAIDAGPETASTTVDLPDGVHTLEVRVADGAGNVGRASRTFTVHGAPLLRLSPDLRNLMTNASAVEVGVLVYSRSQVVVTINGWTAGRDGERYVLTVPLQEGINTIEVVAIDGLDQTSSLVFDVTRDTVAPDIDLSFFGLDPVHCGTRVPYHPNTLSAMLAVDITDDRVGVDPHTGVQLRAGAGADQWRTAPGEVSPFEQVVFLEPGLQDVVVTAIDRAGNRAECRVAIYGVDTDLVRAGDPRIPGAGLGVPYRLLEGGYAFSVSLDPSVAPGAPVGQNQRRTVGYAVDYSVTAGGGASEFIADGRAQCLNVIVPYDPARVEGAGVPEDSLRVFRVLAGGARTFVPVEITGRIDTARNTVTFCSPHLSTYVVTAPAAVPISGISLAYVINNGGRGPTDQRLTLVDLDYMRMRDRRFDIGLPILPSNLNKRVVSSYAHDAKWVPQTSLLAVAYRTSYEIHGHPSSMDELLITDTSTRQLVAGIGCEPPGTEPPYRCEILDYAFTADGASVVIALAAGGSLLDMQGLHLLPLPDRSDPATFVTLDRAPWIRTVLGAHAAVEILGGTVILRGGPPDGWGGADAASIEAGIPDLGIPYQLVVPYAPFYGLDSQSLDVLRGSFDGTCLTNDDGQIITDHTWIESCEVEGHGGCDLETGKCSECLSWIIGAPLTQRLWSGIPDEFQDVDKNPLSCSPFQRELGAGMRRMRGAGSQAIVYDAAAGSWQHSTISYDLYRLVTAAGQLLLVDLPAPGAPARVSSLPAVPDFHDPTYVLSFFTPSSTFVATSDALWTLATAMPPSYATAAELMQQAEPHVVRFGRDSTGALSPPSRHAVHLPEPEPGKVGRSNLVFDAAGRVLIATAAGRVLAHDLATGAAEVRARLPYAANQVVSNYSTVLTRATMALDNRERPVTVVASVAEDALGQELPESMLALLPDDGSLLEERLLSWADGLQFDALGAPPRNVVAALPSSVGRVQSMFALPPPQLFADTGAPASYFAPVATDRPDARAIGIAVRDASGSAVDLAALGPDVGIRIFMVADTLTEEDETALALESSDFTAGVRVRGYVPLPSTAMIVTAAGLAFFDHEEVGGTYNRNYAVYSSVPPASALFPNATVDTSCGLATAAGGTVSLCLRGLELTAPSAADGEREFAADLVRVGTGNTVGGSPLSATSDSLVYLLDRQPPRALGPVLYASRTGPLVLDFSEIVRADQAAPGLFDSRGSLVPSSSRLGIVTAVPPYSRLVVWPNAELAERSWYHVDGYPYRDRAGLYLDQRAFPGWRTRTRYYEHLEAFLGTSVTGELRAMIGALEDAMDSAGSAVHRPQAQAHVSGALKPAIALAPPPVQLMGALLVAKSVQYFSADGFVYDELDASPSFLVSEPALSRMVGDVARYVRWEAAAPARFGFVQPAARELVCAHDRRTCYIDEFLQHYVSLVEHGLVRVDRAAFIALLGSYFDRLAAEGYFGTSRATRSAGTCGDDVVACAVGHMQGSVDAEVAASMGYFAAGWEGGADFATIQERARQALLLAQAGQGMFRSGLESGSVVWHLGDYTGQERVPGWTPAQTRNYATVRSVWTLDLGALSFEDESLFSDTFVGSAAVRLGISSCSLRLDIINTKSILGYDPSRSYNLCDFNDFGRAATGSKLALLYLFNTPTPLGDGRAELTARVPDGIERVELDYQPFYRDAKGWGVDQGQGQWYLGDNLVADVVTETSTTSLWYSTDRGTQYYHPVYDGLSFYYRCPDYLSGVVFSPCSTYAAINPDYYSLAMTEPRFGYLPMRRAILNVEGSDRITIRLRERYRRTRTDMGWVSGQDTLLAVDNIRFCAPDPVSGVLRCAGEGGRLSVERDGPGSIELAGIDALLSEPAPVVVKDGQRFALVPGSPTHMFVARVADEMQGPVIDPEVMLCSSSLPWPTHIEPPPCGRTDLDPIQMYPMAGDGTLFMASSPFPGRRRAVWVATRTIGEDHWPRSVILRIHQDYDAPLVSLRAAAEHAAADRPLAFNLAITEDVAVARVTVRRSSDLDPAAGVVVYEALLSNDLDLNPLSVPGDEAGFTEDSLWIVDEMGPAAGGNRYTVEVEDFLGRIGSDTLTVVGYDVPPFTVTEASARTVLNVGTAARLVVSIPPPGGVAFRYELLSRPGEVPPGTLDENTGVFAAERLGFAFASAEAVVAATGYSLRSASEVWPLDVRGVPAVFRIAGDDFQVIRPGEAFAPLQVEALDIDGQPMGSARSSIRAQFDVVPAAAGFGDRLAYQQPPAVPFDDAGLAVFDASSFAGQGAMPPAYGMGGVRVFVSLVSEAGALVYAPASITTLQSSLASGQGSDNLDDIEYRAAADVIDRAVLEIRLAQVGAIPPPVVYVYWDDSLNPASLPASNWIATFVGLDGRPLDVTAVLSALADLLSNVFPGAVFRVGARLADTDVQVFLNDSARDAGYQPGTLAVSKVVDFGANGVQDLGDWYGDRRKDIYVFPNDALFLDLFLASTNKAAADLAACLLVPVAHELGHAWGLLTNGNYFGSRAGDTYTLERTAEEAIIAFDRQGYHNVNPDPTRENGNVLVGRMMDPVFNPNRRVSPPTMRPWRPMNAAYLKALGLLPR